MAAAACQIKGYYLQRGWLPAAAGFACRWFKPPPYATRGRFDALLDQMWLANPVAVDVRSLV